MTIKRIQETSETSHTDAPAQIREDEQTLTGPTQDPLDITIRRPGMLLAAVVVSAMLSASTGAGTTQATDYPWRRRYEIAEASTAAEEADRELLKTVRGLFEQGSFEFFCDGLESHFSRSLLGLIARHGRAAFKAIAEYLFSGQANPSVVSEALRWLADVNDPSTLTQQWSILQRTLHDPSPRVRDGAILGFAALDDPRATPILLEARNVEQIAELRRLIDQVIAHLARA